MKKLLAPLALLVLAAACSSSSKKADKETMFRTHHDFAFAYYAMGPQGYDRAQSQIYKALELDRDHVELRVLLGQILLRKGSSEDIHSAELVYRSLLKDGDARAPLGLASALERKGIFYDEAARGIASGRRFTEADDPAARAAELSAEAHGFWTDSEAYYRETLEISPNDRNALNGMQRLLVLLDRDEESLEFSDRVLEVTEGEREFWMSQLERPDLTARDEDSLRLSLDEVEKLQIRTHLHAAAVQTSLKRYDEALPHLQAVTALDPLLPEAHSQLAQLFERVGNYEAALMELDQFLRLADLPFDHPDVNEAYERRTAIEEKLARGGSTAIGN